jgi:hypothetical protein
MPPNDFDTLATVIADARLATVSSPSGLARPGEYERAAACGGRPGHRRQTLGGVQALCLQCDSGRVVKLRVSAPSALFDAADVTPGDHTREARVSAGNYPKSGSAHQLSAIAEPRISRPAGRTTADELGTKAARASRLRPGGYPHYRWRRSVTHASPGGARQPMVGGMTIPLQFSGAELSRFKDEKFGVFTHGGLLSLTGARQWGPMVRLELS